MRVFINIVCDFLGGGFIGFYVWLEKYFTSSAAVMTRAPDFRPSTLSRGKHQKNQITLRTSGRPHRRATKT